MAPLLLPEGVGATLSSEITQSPSPGAMAGLDPLVLLHPAEEAQSESLRVLLLIVPAHKVIFSCTAPTFIHNSHGTGLTLRPAAGVALR